MTDQSNHNLTNKAIQVLGMVIIVTVAGIILLSFWALSLRYGLFGAKSSETGGVADEALSILGNVAAAAVGGLVGWLARGVFKTKDQPKETSDE